MSVYSLRLPAFEVVSSFIIWFAHVAYAWYLIGIESALYGDNTNFEWNVWMTMLPYYVLALVLHRFLLWPALNCIAYGWFPVAVGLVYGFTLFITTRIVTNVYSQFGQPDYYVFCVYITYKLLQFISYFSYQIESAKVGGFKKSFFITLRDVRQAQ
ncbi:Pantothenic acid transporter PanT [Trichinella spiralis]|uniref:Pantothenic acid transporter PanT n=1 Tax=Trichinella spiralis TaxID=6334 RepID=A0ABR3KU22_TRISP